MKCLVIDAIAPQLVVCASDGARIASRIGDTNAKLHNRLILQYVDEVARELQMPLAQLDALGCVVGAGSFTGIRLGVATVNGLAFALEKPCVALTSMQELAYPVKTDRFVAAIDARHDNYYGAEFCGDWTRMTRQGCYTGEELRAADCPVYYKSGPSDPQALIDMTQILFAAGKTATLEPLYLKKSQAEREKDGE